MWYRYAIVAVCMSFGVLFWFIHTFLDYVAFHEGTFWQLLITDVPRYEVYIRLTVVGLFVVFGLVMLTVVTARQREERKLSEKGLEYLSLCELSHELVFSKDREGRYRTVNLKTAIALGCSCIKDVEGKTDFDLLPAEQADTLRAIDKQVMASGKAIESEEVIRDAHGENRAYLSRKWPLYDDQGEIDGIGCFAMDITERKRAEEEQERLLYDMAERIKELRCVYEVTKSIRERKSLEVVFQDVVSLIPLGWQYPDITRARVRFEGQEYVSGPFEETSWKLASDIVVGGARRGEVEVFYLEERPLSDEGPFLREERNLIDNLAQTLSELIEHRQAEEDTRQAQEQVIEHQRREREIAEAELANVREELVRHTRLATLGQLAGSIAHELRNPLGAIRNAAYFLKIDATEKKPKWLKHLRIIEDEVSSADGIISDLLEMSRGKEMQKQAVDLSEAVQSAWKRANVPERVQRHLSFDTEPFVVHADWAQLVQVFSNLLLNGKQAIEGDGEIMIAAKRGETYDEIVVHDTGPGVDPAHRKRIFEPLFTTRAKGTGLGLPICRHIVERHGGMLDLLEKAGAGAAFRIRLPRKEA